MRELGVVSAGSLQLLAGAVAMRCQGLPEEFVRGLPDGWSEDRDMMVDRAVVDAAWGRGLALCGNAPLGLDMALIARTKNFGLLGYVASHSPTLGDALTQIIRYYGLMQRGASTWSVETVHSGRQLTFALTPPASIHGAHVVEFVLGSIACLVRKLVGDDAVAHTVSLQHSPHASDTPYQRVFGCSVGFEADANTIMFAHSTLDRQVEGADPVLRKILAAAVEREMPVSDRTSDKLHALLRRELRNGLTTIDEASAVLNVSSRTLTRHLRDEGTTFQECLDQVRFELVRVYRRQSLSALEIALLIGFHDSKSLYRAFKRWSGVSFSEYRFE